MRLDTEFYLFKIKKIRMAILDQVEVLSGPVSSLQQWPKSDKDGEKEEQAKYMRYLFPASLPVSNFFELKAS